jgi:hypothetical protein
VGTIIIYRYLGYYLPSGRIEFHKQVLVVSHFLVEVLLIEDHDSVLDLESQSFFESGQSHTEYEGKFVHFKV